MIIGIDIGGSEIKSILWNKKRVFQTLKFKTPRNKKYFEKKILFIVKKFSEKGRIKQIGIGAAGIVRGTTIQYAPNIRYLKNFDFKKLLSDKTIGLDNDARCFARAEITSLSLVRSVDVKIPIFTSSSLPEISARRKNKNGLLFTIGTGIGRAYWKGKAVQKIKKFEYPERWERQYQKIRDSRDYKKLADFLVPKLIIIIKKYKPDQVLFGGGMMKKYFFWPYLLRNLKMAHMMVPMKFVRLPYAGAIGAALLLENGV